MGYRVAVVGATGNVGREMLNILEELEFPVDEIHAIASRKSIGVDVGWKDGVIDCEDIAQFDFCQRRPRADERLGRLLARNGRRRSAAPARWSSTTRRPGGWTPTCR